MNRRQFAAFLTSGLFSGDFIMASNASSTVMMEYASPHTFVQTLDRVVKAIQAAGLMLFAHIDHAAAASAAGLTMPPTVVLLYGNAKAGTPVMLAEPRAALDLPLRVLLRQDTEGRTQLSFHPIAATLLKAGAPAELAHRLEPAQWLLRDALAP